MNLRAAVEDARSLTNQLSEYCAGGASLKANKTKQEMDKEFVKFLREVKGKKAVALLHYSGHGLFCSNSTYILGTDYDGDEFAWYQSGLKLAEMVSMLEDAIGHDGAAIIILDCCRELVGDIGGGKDAVASRQGNVLPVYSCAPGSRTPDRDSYTKTLLKVLQEEKKQYVPWCVLNIFSKANEEHNKKHKTGATFPEMASCSRFLKLHLRDSERLWDKLVRAPLRR